MSGTTEIRKQTTTEVKEEPSQTKITTETTKTKERPKETLVKETTTTVETD